jgi:hypothetical protein
VKTDAEIKPTACPHVDVQAFLKRRALEIAAGEGDAA